MGSSYGYLIKNPNSIKKIGIWNRIAILGKNYYLICLLQELEKNIAKGLDGWETRLKVKINIIIQRCML